MDKKQADTVAALATAGMLAPVLGAGYLLLKPNAPATTAPTETPPLSANDIWNLIQNIVDKEIKSFIGGFVTIEQVGAEIAAEIAKIIILTPTQVLSIVESAIAKIVFPVGVTVAQVESIVSSAIAKAIGGIVIPVTSGFVTAEQLAAAITGPITSLVLQDIKNLTSGFVTAEQVATQITNAIAQIALPVSVTVAQVESIVKSAIADIVFPASLTLAQVESIVSTAISGIVFPTGGVTLAQVESIVSTAINGIVFPPSLSTTQIDQIESLIGTVLGQALPTIEKDVLSLVPVTTKDIINSLYGFDLTVANQLNQYSITGIRDTANAANNLANTIRNVWNGFVSTWNQLRGWNVNIFGVNIGLGFLPAIPAV